VTHRVRRAAVLAGLASISCLVTGCGGAWMPDPVTESGSDTRTLWRIFLWVAAAIALVVYGLVVYVLVRARRRSGGEPSQRQYVFKVEFIYTAIPVAIVAVLLSLSIFTENRIDDVVDDPDLVVDVIGFQWQWQFDYVDEDVSVTGVPGVEPVLVLPVGRTVRLRLESRDVIHSFWVPHFLIKRDLTPGIENEIDVNLTEEGEWRGFCSEFCGLEHWQMTFHVQGVSSDDFDTWLEEQREAT
jgi:cytochrome c oxidase subunit 2